MLFRSTGDFAEPLVVAASRSDEMILSLQVVPYVDSHHLLLSRDITQAHKLAVMRRDFVANVSHELRTPLTVLIGFLETVLELKLDPNRSRDYLNLMAEQSQRMRRIIEDLLALSTLESAPLPPTDERVDMAALLAQVRNEAESLSRGRHKISFHVDPAVDLTGNSTEITSALSNLANNAVRYTPDGVSIDIRWRGVGDEAPHRVTRFRQAIHHAVEGLGERTDRYANAQTVIIDAEQFALLEELADQTTGPQAAGERGPVAIKHVAQSGAHARWRRIGCRWRGRLGLRNRGRYGAWLDNAHPGARRRQGCLQIG